MNPIRRKTFIRTALGTCLLISLTCTPAARFTTAGKEGAPPDKSKSWVPIDKDKIMASVAKFKGIPYKWGGESKEGMDCSGLVKSVFADLERIELPHKASEQAQYGVKVTREQLKCGDLVFFKMQGFRIDHVGICLGDGNFVHASSITGVTVTSLEDDYYKERFAFGKRLYYE
jgi:cell wall-associated NlpC family hydrolase